MNFINYAIPFVVLSLSSVSHSESLPVTVIKTPLQICAEKKLKEFRKRTLVSESDEPMYLDKFKQECAKDKLVANQEQQVIDAAKAAEKDKKVVAAPTKSASSDSSSASNSNPPKPATPPATSTSSSGSGSGQFVFGGCGNAEQCAAVMAEAGREKYTWNSPGLQAYLGELWGNNFNYAYSLGGTFEQPDSPCSEKNKGELIAFDMGTEIRPVACMSNFATQEELKKMAEKIKNTKVDTLPVVIAVKKPQYQCKVIKEADKLEEGQMRICNGSCSCGSENVGSVWSGGPGCGESKCIRLDGGPVKSAKKDEKKDDKTAAPVAQNPQPAAEREPAQQQQIPPQFYQGFDPQRDGAAGP